MRELVKPYLSACTFRRRRLDVSRPRRTSADAPPGPRRTPSRSVCRSIALQHHPPRERRHGRAFLSLSQDFLSVADERGKQVTDDATRAGLDLDGDGHAGQKLNGLALDL